MASAIASSLPMRTRYSLRLKVALAFSALTVLLLVAQALGVRVLAEAQEEKLIAALIAEDMRSLMQTYRSDPVLLPPIDPQLGGYVSQEGRAPATLPASVRDLDNGTHEINVAGEEVHVAIAPFGDARIYRVYNFSAYERRFREVIDALMVGTGALALVTIWLAFGLSGLLVRQVARLAGQVRALRTGEARALNPGRYDEIEVAELVAAFNEYHDRMARLIEREKEFTGNLSHELRSPLTAIKTSCELLEQDATIGPKSKARLRQIDHAADRMIELVSALLQLAREEQPSDVARVRLADAVREALAPFADVVAAKGVEVLVEVDPESWVQANRSALVIVLSNLIHNAVRCTDRGRIRVSEADGWLQIEDTGCGIPRESLSLVFERFYQASRENATERGLGIGLSIVKKICDLCQWPIELASEPHQGTRVRLQVPFSPPDVSPASQKIDTSLTGTSQAPA
jgi:signal transduction histidine kinase